MLKHQITGEAQGPDSQVPELIGDYALCIQKVASPTTDSLVYNFPFLRFLPGTYYKQLCDKTLKCRNALMEQVFTKGKVTVRGIRPGLNPIPCR